MRFTPLRTLGFALLGAMLVVGAAACSDSSDADDTRTPHPVPSVIATVENSHDNPANGGIEPANPNSLWKARSPRPAMRSTSDSVPTAGRHPQVPVNLEPGRYLLSVF